MEHVFTSDGLFLTLLYLDFGLFLTSVWDLLYLSFLLCFEVLPPFLLVPVTGVPLGKIVFFLTFCLVFCLGIVVADDALFFLFTQTANPSSVMAGSGGSAYRIRTGPPPS